MSSRIHTEEHAFTLHGVEGRMFNKVLDEQTGLFLNQRFAASRPFNEPGYKPGSQITVEVRFDDECGNRHQSFAITGHVREPRARDWSMGGCIHDEIAKYFPELAPLIKWHLFDTSGPMHYVANTCYHASDRDHNGRAAGEPDAWMLGVRFGTSPITHKLERPFHSWLRAALEFNESAAKTNPDYVEFEPVAVEHKKDSSYDFAPKYTFKGYDCEWYRCPFDNLREAEEFSAALRLSPQFVKVPTSWSKGKARDLDAARRAAVWLDATDEQLCLPRAELEAALLARLPALVAAFRADMDASGLLWEQPPSPRA